MKIFHSFFYLSIFLFVTITDIIAQQTAVVSNSVSYVKLNCYPPNGASKIFNAPDTNSIHPAWMSDYKGGSSFGSSWSFIATKLFSNTQGKFLLGDLYSSRGGKINIIQNGFKGQIYVLLKEWECDKN